MSDETPKAQRQCRECRHLRNDAKYLEAAFKGLTSLSSGYGSARSDDGICLRHDRYPSARSSRPEFSPPTTQVTAAEECIRTKAYFVDSSRSSARFELPNPFW